MNLYLKSGISRNVAALFIGLVITIILIIVIDKTFGWIMNIKVSRSDFFPESGDVDGLGWSARTDRKLKNTASGYSRAHKEMFDNEVIFDVTYNYDMLYRRQVPGNPVGNTDKFVIFFGGSQTFGEGLNDRDTIPAIVQKEALSHRVYNYAYRGYGPHQMLKKLETYQLENEVPEAGGIAFFQYFSYHVPRVAGTMSYISWAGAGAPYYDVNSKGQLEYLGSFATGRFFRTFLYWMLGKSAIAKHYRVDLPAKLTRHHYDIVCRVLDQSRNIFLDQYPDSRFVVIIGMTDNPNDPFEEECLKNNNIEYVDMRSYYEANKGFEFPQNGHFTPKASRLIAQQLIPLIGK
jgi:hypothetical protein